MLPKGGAKNKVCGGGEFNPLSLRWDGGMLFLWKCLWIYDCQMGWGDICWREFDAQAAEMELKLLMVSGKFIASFVCNNSFTCQEWRSFIFYQRNKRFLLSQRWQHSSSHLSRLLQQPPKQRLKVEPTGGGPGGGGIHVVQKHQPYDLILHAAESFSYCCYYYHYFMFLSTIMILGDRVMTRDKCVRALVFFWDFPHSSKEQLRSDTSWPVWDLGKTTWWRVLYLPQLSWEIPPWERVCLHHRR